MQGVSPEFDKLAPKYPPKKPPHKKSSPSGFNLFESDGGGPDFCSREDEEEFGAGFLFGSKQKYRPKKEKNGDEGCEGEEDGDEDEDEDDDPTSSLWLNFKINGPKLIPFVISVSIYFYYLLNIEAEEEGSYAVTIKCLPIASLLIFHLLHGVRWNGSEHAFGRKIMLALIFSIIGDAFLVYERYFLQGMFAFAFAQISYIMAFGMEPLCWTAGSIIYAVTSIGLGMIVPGLIKQEGGLLLSVPIYFILLTTMLWRACARIQIFEDVLCWSKLIAVFGALQFVISDSILGLNKFYGDIPDSHVFIMGFYYSAQLCLSLSVINVHKAVLHPETEEEEEKGDSEFDRRGRPIPNSGKNINWDDSEDEEEFIEPNTMRTTRSTSKLE